MANKAKLSKILEVALANTRAAKDLIGLVGVKGTFTVDATGLVISNVTGVNFTVAATATAGAFTITMKYPFTFFLGANGMVFAPKATAANGDAFALDFSATTAASCTVVTCRIVAKAAPFAVMAPGGSGAVVTFEIKGIRSSSVDNI